MSHRQLVAVRQAACTRETSDVREKERERGVCVCVCVIGSVSCDETEVIATLVRIIEIIRVLVQILIEILIIK